MLFQELESKPQKLWSSRRCAVVLLLSIVVFFGLVSLAASQISFTPTIEVAISRRAEAWVCVPKDVGRMDLGDSVPLYLRYMNAKGEGVRMEIVAASPSAPSSSLASPSASPSASPLPSASTYLIRTDVVLEQKNSAFLIYPKQTLFRFLLRKAAR